MSRISAKVYSSYKLCISNLLQLSKQKYVAVSFRSTSEQLLSAEGGVQNITSQPLSLSVSIGN